MQGKAFQVFVPPKIIESWIEWKGPSQTEQELRSPNQTIGEIVDIFVRRGNVKDKK